LVKKTQKPRKASEKSPLLRQGMLDINLVQCFITSIEVKDLLPEQVTRHIPIFLDW
jgi:hypothetical protein